MFSYKLNSISSLWLPIFKAKFAKALEKYQPLKENQVIVILGSTGSGKSTVANYLSGCQMEEKLGDVLETLITPKAGQKEVCKIGYGISSETFFPQAIPSGKGFDYVDCPPFDPNRIIEDKVVSTVLTQSAIQESKNIRGIVACINHYSFRHEDAFYRAIDPIIKSVENFNECNQSILFLVTHVSSSKLEPKHILNNIKIFADAEEKGIIVKKNSARVLLKLLTEHPNQLHLFHPLDEKDRDCITSKIQEFKPIPKTQFSFPKYDVDHEKLEKDISNLAIHFTTLFKTISLISDYSPDFDKTKQSILKTLLADEEALLPIYKIAKMANFDSAIIKDFIAQYEQHQNQQIAEFQPRLNMKR